MLFTLESTASVLSRILIDTQNVVKHKKLVILLWAWLVSFCLRGGGYCTDISLIITTTKTNKILNSALADIQFLPKGFKNAFLSMCLLRCTKLGL